MVCYSALVIIKELIALIFIVTIMEGSGGIEKGDNAKYIAVQVVKNGISWSLKLLDEAKVVGKGKREEKLMYVYGD